MADDSRSSSPLATRRTSAPAVSVDAFLDTARRVPSQASARLVFALDATMSRQPSWEAARHVQGEMFDAAAALGGMQVQLAYFRGLRECRASRWVADPRALHDLMAGIACQGGQTQIARVLGHVKAEAGRVPVKAMIYVGDAMEEPVDELCALAGELGLLGIKAFMFHEGRDGGAEQAFREVARLTGGAYLPFDSNAPGSLAGLLRAVAAYASGGAGALSRLASSEPGARVLIGAMGAAR